MTPKKHKNVVYVDEYYTCTRCGRKNLKFEEVGYRADPDGQIIESSIICLSCFLKSPQFLKIMKKTPEATKIVDKIIGQTDYNYNRRMMRRVLKKEKKG